MRAYVLPALLLVMPLSHHAAPRPRAPHVDLPVADANDNRRPAGAQRGRTLEVTLVAREALWYPTRSTPAMQIQAFSEGEALPSIPGPLLRVREGTTVTVTVRNTL